MSAYVIRNSVPTPEEMGEYLGISSERVSAVRSIMEAPIRSKTASRSLTYRTARKAASAKKAAKKAAKR
jgi:hypothetical protein